MPPAISAYKKDRYYLRIGPEYQPRQDHQFMNAAEQALLNWLNKEINSGNTRIFVPTALLEHTTPEGLAEARRLAKLTGCELVVRAK